ncbi:carboxylesterase/lipase family protein [Dictyobacter kobayashii]|uniref:Carboxylic ester hydrolase n=1 Tax=Dictyobacter kobayashii TaxID=2014872 RepID=A0A402ARL0_9CHLR|nr:carboxylesterase/lipase family protein [Dictyobacter kobayashii]GCE21729.1 carboxylesterase [Dictyobacter kobayashii]
MENIIVDTSYGKLQGAQEGPVLTFKGVPFARPPIGALRFCAPELPEPWPGVRDATTYGPRALQALDPQLAAEATVDEDCLYLNVWTPGLGQGRRPVLVWIHGGALVSGSGSEPQYDGTKFAFDGDMIVVTLNYRLGAAGFLYLGDLLGEKYASSGNSGLLDIVAALKWVHDNIARFGGDPGRVTIMGESAGAMCVGALLALPAAQGFFQQAILESGAGQTTRDTASATSFTRRFLAGLGLSAHDAKKLLTLSTDELLAAQIRFIQSESIGGVRHLRYFGPVVDGTTLPHYPLDAVAQGKGARVPLLLGTNRDEARLYMALDPQLTHPDRQILHTLFGSNSATAADAYATARQKHPPEEAWAIVLTDYLYRLGVIHLAREQAYQHLPVWLYRFDWDKTSHGAFHSLELPFVWNTLNRPHPLQIPFRFTFGAEEYALAEQMHAAWIAFIRNGNPNVTTLPPWPTYANDERETMLFNTVSRVVSLPPEQDPANYQRHGLTF